MPVKKSALKELRKNTTRTERNQEAKMNMRYLIKKARHAVDKKDMTAAQDYLKKAVKAIDKMAQKGVIHKNSAARRKSRLTRLASAKQK